MTAPAPADRLQHARWLVRVAIGLFILGVALVALGRPLVDALGGPGVTPAVDHLALTRPAFVPAGRAARAPASHPGVEPHFAPGVGRLAPPPAALLWPPPRVP